jgi:hypothetical protein
MSRPRAVLYVQSKTRLLCCCCCCYCSCSCYDSYAGDMYPESAEMFQRVHRQVGLHRIWMHIHRSGCDLGIWGKVEENWPELFIYKVCFHIYVYIYIYLFGLYVYSLIYYSNSQCLHFCTWLRACWTRRSSSLQQMIYFQNLTDTCSHLMMLKIWDLRLRMTLSAG